MSNFAAQIPPGVSAAIANKLTKPEPLYWICKQVCGSAQKTLCVRQLCVTFKGNFVDPLGTESQKSKVRVRIQTHLCPNSPVLHACTHSHRPELATHDGNSEPTCAPHPQNFVG